MHNAPNKVLCKKRLEQVIELIEGKGIVDKSAIEEKNVLAILKSLDLDMVSVDQIHDIIWHLIKRMPEKSRSKKLGLNKKILEFFRDIFALNIEIHSELYDILVNFLNGLQSGKRFLGSNILDFSYTKFNSESFKMLLNMKENTQIEEIRFAHVKYDDGLLFDDQDRAKDFFNFLKSLPNLKKLDLSSNELGLKDSDFFDKVMSDLLSKLIELKLCDNQIKDDSAILTHLSEHTHKLDLSCNMLTADKCRELKLTHKSDYVVQSQLDPNHYIDNDQGVCIISNEGGREKYYTEHLNDYSQVVLEEYYSNDDKLSVIKRDQVEPGEYRVNNLEPSKLKETIKNFMGRNDGFIISVDKSKSDRFYTNRVCFIKPGEKITPEQVHGVDVINDGSQEQPLRDNIKAGQEPGPQVSPPAALDVSGPENQPNPNTTSRGESPSPVALANQEDSTTPDADKHQDTERLGSPTGDNSDLRRAVSAEVAPHNIFDGLGYIEKVLPGITDQIKGQGLGEAIDPTGFYFTENANNHQSPKDYNRFLRIIGESWHPICELPQQFEGCFRKPVPQLISGTECQWIKKLSEEGSVHHINVEAATGCASVGGGLRGDDSASKNRYKVTCAIQIRRVVEKYIYQPFKEKCDDVLKQSPFPPFSHFIDHTLCGGLLEITLSIFVDTKKSSQEFQMKLNANVIGTRGLIKILKKKKSENTEISFTSQIAGFSAAFSFGVGHVKDLDKLYEEAMLWACKTPVNHPIVLVSHALPWSHSSVNLLQQWRINNHYCYAMLRDMFQSKWVISGRDALFFRNKSDMVLVVASEDSVIFKGPMTHDYFRLIAKSSSHLLRVNDDFRIQVDGGKTGYLAVIRHGVGGHYRLRWVTEREASFFKFERDISGTQSEFLAADSRTQYYLIDSKSGRIMVAGDDKGCFFDKKTGKTNPVAISMRMKDKSHLENLVAEIEQRVPNISGNRYAFLSPSITATQRHISAANHDHAPGPANALS